MCLQAILNLFKSKPSNYELPSPQIRIDPDNIQKLPREATLMMDGANYGVLPAGTIIIKGLSPDTWITSVQPTNSMEPFIDDGMQLFLEPVMIYQDLIVGDIINVSVQEGIVFSCLHRIVEISSDQFGWYCRTKGDNPACVIDPYLIRPVNITHVFRGVIC